MGESRYGISNEEIRNYCELSETVPMMLSEDYKERFKAEFFQVNNRVSKLKKVVLNYLDTGELGFEPTCPFDVLAYQLKIMEDYMWVLKLRASYEGIDLLENFKEEKENG